MARKAKPQHFHLSSKYMVFKITDKKKALALACSEKIGVLPGMWGIGSWVLLPAGILRPLSPHQGD